jgi:hypothetical protein
MALQLFKIADYTVGSPVSTITFSSIPQAYTDLIVKISARSADGGSVQDRITMKINGNAYGSWNLKYIGNANNSAATYDQTSLGSNNINYMPSSNATGNTFCNTEIYIPNYTSSNYKSMSIDGMMENNSSTVYFGLEAALWSNTAAITQLDFLTAAAANYATNTTFTLYGVL